MMQLKTLTITRRGDVQWRVTGDHHCGPKDQLRRQLVWMGAVGGYSSLPTGPASIPIKYTVVVQCAPTLDAQGFLFDQVTMADYMAQLAKQETDLSCERLVDHAATTLLARLRSDAPTCHVKTLTLTLSPAPYAAEVTAHYAQLRRRAHDGQRQATRGL
jgi:hypothetical protein